MTLEPLGDSALIVRFKNGGDEELLPRIWSARRAVERARISGVVEVTSSYESLAVFFDLPSLVIAAGEQTPEEFLRAQIMTSLAHAGTAAPEQRRIEIPVCYQFQLDLARVAQITSMPEEEIISRHSAADYAVACIGFMPGFPYLAGLPAELEAPRLPTPRTRVPAGSVAIAGKQAGIYPFESPGGWNVIGRTPLRLFDASASPPALLRPGERVRFRAISTEEFRSYVS